MFISHIKQSILEYFNVIYYIQHLHLIFSVYVQHFNLTCVCVFFFFLSFLFSVCIFSWFNVPDLDTLTIGADSASEVLPSHGQVSLQVEVIKSNGASSVFSISVPRGSSLFEALNLLQDKQTGFT